MVHELMDQRVGGSDDQLTQLPMDLRPSQPSGHFRDPPDPPSQILS
jgi:hypothetical protein